MSIQLANNRTSKIIASTCGKYCQTTWPAITDIIDAFVSDRVPGFALYAAHRIHYTSDSELFSLNGSQIGFYCGKKEKWVIDLTISWLILQKKDLHF